MKNHAMEIVMKVKDLAEKYSMKILNKADIETREAHGCYCGDLLSWVMSRAKEDDVWLTVMGNVNSVGVAVLSDVACIVLTENASFDDDAKKRAEENSVIVLQTDMNTFETAIKVNEMLK